MTLAEKTYRRVQRYYRVTANAVAARIGMYTGYYRRARGARIIVYHGICEKNPLRFNTLFVTRKTFEKHLQFYRRYCHLVSLDDYYHERFDTTKFNICISFDDGLAGAYRHALPLLEKYQVPAAFFITGIRDAGYDILWNDFLSLVYAYAPATIQLGEVSFRKRKNKYRELNTQTTLNDWLRSRSFEEKKKCMDSLQSYALFRNDPLLQDYWLQMSDGEINTLSASSLVTIGSHGYYHNDLAQDEEAFLKAELENSRKFLEQLTGQEITSIAFPYGSYSGRVIDAAKQAGYRELLAADFLSNKDNSAPMLKERMAVNPFIGSAAQLRAIIKGNYA